MKVCLLHKGSLCSSAGSLTETVKNSLITIKINKTAFKSLFLHSHRQLPLQYNLFEPSIQNITVLEKQMDSHTGNNVNYLIYYGLQTTQELHNCGKIHSEIHWQSFLSTYYHEHVRTRKSYCICLFCFFYSIFFSLLSINLVFSHRHTLVLLSL